MEEMYRANIFLYSLVSIEWQRSVDIFIYIKVRSQISCCLMPLSIFLSPVSDISKNKLRVLPEMRRKEPAKEISIPPSSSFYSDLFRPAS